MKCPHCKKVPYPVYDNETKQWNIKNLFKVDWLMLILTISILFSIWAYKHDTEECNQLIEHTCYFAEKYGCNKIIVRGDDNASKYSPYFIDGEIPK